MKNLILGLLLIFSVRTFAIPGNIEDLEKAPEVEKKLQELSHEGWEKTGSSSLVTINSFYYTNGSQGRTLLLVLPIYGRRYLMQSCVAAVFDRGASVEYSFKEFVQLGGFCR